MILTIFEVENLKKEVLQKFSVQIHFHDGCGGQYFTVDQPTEDLKEFVIEFFATRELEVVFSETGEQFRVVKKIKKNP